ncbi:MAG: DUF2079 domain-containing protein, partial [Blautia sp.]|nr:DUF2079 domain-containing protein [Blautia sp.]
TQKMTFSLDVQESIEDRSVEFRTYYDGKGTFDFHSLKVRRGGWIRKAAIAIGLMSLAMAVLFFLYRGISLPGALYTVLFYGAASLSLTSDLRIGFFIVLTQMLWLALVLKVPFFRKEIRHVQAYEVLMLILTSFLVISAVNIIRYHGGVENLDFVKNIVPEYYVLEMVGTAHILALLRLCVKNRSCSSWALLISAFFFGFTCILHGRDVYFAIGVSVILGFFIYYLLKSDPGMLRRAGGIRSYRGPFIAVCIMSAVLTAYFVCITVCRYRTFSSANFDMGIFCQMYEYMAKTGLPMTTSERGYLLSHFYIHFSPVFYLFLPVYMLFRSPECLLVIQSVLVFTAVIPLFLICRHYRLKPFTAMLVSFVYLVMPATQEPLFYDFHEYKFIPFFLFWFIYLYLEHKNLRAFIFLFLTLAIKEDLAIYLVVFALYRILAEKDYKRGAVVLTISLLYFAGVMAFIQSHGMGLMEGHYKMYYLSGERGVFALAKNIILAPGRFVRQVFDEENFKYIFYTLGVLAFVPLKAGDFKRLTLLLPYVAFGLMTDYAYQHDVGFQYV